MKNLDIFNCDALDYMSFAEWVDLCRRIIESYNTVKSDSKD